MATGDQNDIQSRLTALLPAEWFTSGQTPIVQGILAGIANGLAFIYSALAYVRQQTRIATATDGFLDLIARDYLGTTLVRKAYQTDASFRARILALIIRERVTRNGLVSVLTAITGRAPLVIEPANVNDCGATNSALSAGYCGVARCGSLAVPFTAMVISYRPLATGGLAGGAYTDNASITGLGSSLSMGFMGSLSLLTSSATDADIYAAVDSVRPVGVTIWTAITNSPANGPGYNLFNLGSSTLGGTNVLI